MLENEQAQTLEKESELIDNFGKSEKSDFEKLVIAKRFIKKLSKTNEDLHLKIMEYQKIIVGNLELDKKEVYLIKQENKYKDLSRQIRKLKKDNVKLKTKNKCQNSGSN